MSEATFLQLFLLLNVFIIGVLVTIAVRHAFAHFRPAVQPPEAEHVRPANTSVHLSPVAKGRLLRTAQSRYQIVLERSALELQRDLKTTAAQLNKKLEKLGNDIVSSETSHYHHALDELREQAELVLASTQTAMATQQSELKEKVAARQAELEEALTDEMAAEKQHLIEQMDTKLADAIASFLTETLGHNVDLGAQTAYLVATLEEHKDELKNGVGREA